MTGLLLAALALSNAVFTVTWDEANGGLDSLVLNNDSVVLYMAMCSGLLGTYGDTTMTEGQRE